MRRWWTRILLQIVMKTIRFVNLFNNLQISFHLKMSPKVFGFLICSNNINPATAASANFSVRRSFLAHLLSDENNDIREQMLVCIKLGTKHTLREVWTSIILNGNWNGLIRGYILIYLGRPPKFERTFNLKRTEIKINARASISVQSKMSVQIDSYNKVNI